MDVADELSRNTSQAEGKLTTGDLVMDNLLVELGKVAGLAGIAIGAAVLVFRDVIRKRIFPRLPPEHAYRLLRIIVIATWSIAILGIVVWQMPVIVAGSGNTVITGSSIAQ
jgi:hypothetical protein